MPKQRELIYHVLSYCHNMQCVAVSSSVGSLETLTRFYNNHACALRGQVMPLYTLRLDISSQIEILVSVKGQKIRRRSDVT